MLAAAELQKLIPEIEIKQFKGSETGKKLTSFSGNIYFIGHGVPEGIQAENSIISWLAIKLLILDTSNAQNTFFIACNSMQGADSISSNTKLVLGFFGYQDAIVLTQQAVAIAHLLNGNKQKSKFVRFASQLRMSYLQQFPAQAQMLGWIDNIINGGNSYTPPPQSCNSYQFYQNRAQNRIPGTVDRSIFEGENFVATDFDRNPAIQRGWAIGGSYADIYRENEEKYFWAGMASYIAMQVNIGRVMIDLILDIINNDLSLFGLLQTAITLAGLIPTFYLELNVEFQFSIFDTNFIFLLNQIILEAIDLIIDIRESPGLGTATSDFIGSLTELFNFFTHVNEGIYGHITWTYLTYQAEGLNCVNELVEERDDQVGFPGARWIKDHFSKIGNSNVVSGAQDLAYAEQFLFAPNVYRLYDQTLIDLVGEFLFVWFGKITITTYWDSWFGWSYLVVIITPELYFFRGDLGSDAQLTDRDDRTDWAVDFLVPDFRDVAWEQQSTFNFLGRLRTAGVRNGGNY